MKSGLLAVFGAFSLLVLSGPVHQLASPPPVVASADLPLWLNIPAAGEVSSVSYTGSVGMEQSSGIIDVDVPGDADRAFSAMKARLAANGFDVEDRLTSVDSLFGASSFADATDPFTGRHLQIIKLDAPGGSTFRITYDNPPAIVAQAD